MFLSEIGSGRREQLESIDPAAVWQFSCRTEIMRGASPLRYPGGKWRWESYFHRVLSLNDLNGATYVEPYAGGASLALSLLFSGSVSEIHLNDLDRSIFAFWHTVLRQNKELVRRVSSTRLTVKEWEKQKEIHLQRSTANLFDLGFATFYLNRTNISGVLNGGIIGGKDQSGEWKIDARFNRTNLAERLRRVGQYSAQIHIANLDAIEFLGSVVPELPNSTLVYLDPPYYEKGRDLYLNAYDDEDHLIVKRAIRKHVKKNWIVSYDDVPPVRRLYSRFRSRRMKLNYSARVSRIGREVLFFAQGVRIPRG